MSNSHLFCDTVLRGHVAAITLLVFRLSPTENECHHAIRTGSLGVKDMSDGALDIC